MKGGTLGLIGVYIPEPSLSIQAVARRLGRFSYQAIVVPTAKLQAQGGHRNAWHRILHHVSQGLVVVRDRIVLPESAIKQACKNNPYSRFGSFWICHHCFTCIDNEMTKVFSPPSSARKICGGIGEAASRKSKQESTLRSSHFSRS